MARKKRNKLGEMLDQFSLKATKATGTSIAFVLALSVILVWLITGPLFQFSDSWQLVINTGTTIITFLMVRSGEPQNEEIGFRFIYLLCRRVAKVTLVSRTAPTVLLSAALRDDCAAPDVA
jgi:low affinity iron permease